jgi:tRNA(adenine34) deaminase
MTEQDDLYWMQKAIDLAKEAAIQDEVPVGAVVVLNNEIIGQGFNHPIQSSDPTAHAEIAALRSAAARIHNYRIVDARLYVTLEPCLMCAGAMIHARIDKCIFGAFDLKSGVVMSQAKTFDSPFLNHVVKYEGGLLSEECGAILSQFFRGKR